MGTRSLTCVVADGSYRVTQYGHMDGDPAWLGSGILEFIRNYIRIPFERGEFKNTLVSQTMLLDNPHEVPSPLEFERAEGGELLKMIAELGPNEKIALENDLGFAGESMHCEWVYVIDLDTMKLEVYEGWNKRKVAKTQRFADLDISESSPEFKQVRLKAEFYLDAPPSKEDFVKFCTGKKRYIANEPTPEEIAASRPIPTAEQEWMASGQAWF